jgi:hypothetical protein
MMKALLLAAVVAAPVLPMHAQADVTAPVRKFIEAFNKGDSQAAYATFASGNISIVDEFAPHQWVGPHAPQDWVADYDKHAAATGVTDGKVTYGPATRTEIEGARAYVVLPTVYLYKEHGKPTREEGQVTAVLHKEAGVWKMRGWTWTGVKPHPGK